MNKHLKKIFAVILLSITGLTLVGCDSNEADTVSHNMSKDADQFKINRRIVFLNGITDSYLLSIEGLYVQQQMKVINLQ